MTSRALATLIALQFGPSIITEISVIFITEILVTENYDMENPFKYGTIVAEPYFTDRREEFKTILNFLNSPNHLILISPRRFGKTSLIKKVLSNLNRRYIYINVQKAVSTADLASLLIKEAIKGHPLEKIKTYLRNFRIIPTISMNPITNGIDISFSATGDGNVLLEDAFDLLESIGSSDNRLIVVLDEFQEILSLEKGIDKRLRSFMQEQSHVNYIFLGSQESMMTEIFEKVKSPFYHFGQLMYLKKIPYEDFFTYIVQGLKAVALNAEAIAKEILQITQCHPYYTQQLSSTVWDLLAYKKIAQDEPPVKTAIAQLIAIHDLDYERLWMSFSKTDRRILRDVAIGNPLSSPGYATSTNYTAANRLMKSGYLIKIDKYEIEDPFFQRWVLETQN